jgi:beta-glucosidase
MSLYYNDGRRLLEPGSFKVFVGPCQPDKTSCELLGQSPLSAQFEVRGSSLVLE